MVQRATTGRGIGRACGRGRGRGSRNTIRNRTVTPRSSREPTSEGNISLPPPYHEGITAEALISMQRSIEGLADRLDR